MGGKAAAYLNASIGFNQQAFFRQHFFDAQTNTALHFADAGHSTKGVDVFLIRQHHPSARSVERFVGLHDGVGEVGLDGLLMHVGK
ncbi:hypothetical protein D9M73_192720 [compost metagenome]